MPHSLHRFLSTLVPIAPPGFAAYAVLSLAFVVFPGGIQAQFRSFTARDGLPAGEVFQIEAWNGKTLFATGEGLAVFDGVTFRTWERADGLPGRTVQSIDFAADGTILLSGEGGVAVWDGEATFVEDVPGPLDEFGEIYVFRYCEAEDGSRWALGTFGLARNDGSGWTPVAPTGAPSWITYRSLHCASDGSIWIGTIDAGVYRLRDGVWTRFVEYVDFDGGFVSHITEDDAGGIWISTGEAAARFDGSAWTSYGPAQGMLPGVIRSYQDSRGDLWFANYEGFTRWNGITWRRFTVDDGLPLEGGGSVGEGPDGAIWLGLRSGAARFDLSEWDRFTVTDGLADDQTYCTFEDEAGDIWVGGLHGTSRWDGATWHLLPVVAPSPGQLEAVNDIIQDAAGRMWFAAAHGLAIRDGANWTGPLGPGQGFADAIMNDLLEDSRGRMWVANAGGVSRLDGETWTHWTGGVDTPFAGQFQRLAEDSRGTIWAATDKTLLRWTEASGWEEMPSPTGEEFSFLFCVAVGPDDVVWVGGFNDLYRFDDPGWTTFTPAEGLVGNFVRDLLFDRTGALWIATEQGLGRLKEGVFGSYVVGESPLPVNTLFGLYEDAEGAIWMNGGGVVRHLPDRVAAVAVPVTTPPASSSSRLQTVTWAAANKEGDEAVFQTSLDGAPWSPPSAVTVWGRDGLGDGDHELRIRAIDGIGNVQSPPTLVPFTVDATPPLPVLTAPTFNEPVSGSVALVGTTEDARFVRYTVDVRGVGDPDWIPLAAGEEPVTEDVLATWDTTDRPEGGHQIRLRVLDDVGLVGTVVGQVRVDNRAPFAAETSPVRMTPAGGEVYTTEGEVRLYVPPGAFAEETQIRLDLVGNEAVPEQLPGGATRVWSGVDLSWGAVVPGKASTLDLRLPEEPSGPPEVYVSRGEGSWEFLGGTWDPDTGILTLPVQQPGRHAVFTGGTGASIVPPGLSTLTLTPRVVRPGQQPLTISFSLEREGPVTVRVYNRAGRLVRTVVRGVGYGSGLQAVRWDGRDESGGPVVDGLYLVAVEALGSRQTKSVAVAR